MVMVVFGNKKYTEQEFVDGSAANNRCALAFVFLLMTVPCFAQRPNKCHDVVSFRDGSVFRGTVLEYDKSGNFEMTTRSGSVIRMSASNVRNIKQKCPELNQNRAAQTQNPNMRNYTGWYNASRLVWFAAQESVGMGVQHSYGMQFHRLIGAGIGMGIEKLGFVAGATATIPAYAEVRGYLWAKEISPFYAIGTGWAATWNTRQIERTNGAPAARYKDEWKGGWMGHGQVGLQFGSLIFLHVGLRYQHLKLRKPSQSWSNNELSILQKRIEFGLGFILL